MANYLDELIRRVILSKNLPEKDDSIEDPPYLSLNVSSPDVEKLFSVEFVSDRGSRTDPLRLALHVPSRKVMYTYSYWKGKYVFWDFGGTEDQMIIVGKIGGLKPHFLVDYL